MRDFPGGLSASLGHLGNGKPRTNREFAPAFGAAGAWTVTGILWSLAGSVVSVITGAINVDYLEQVLPLKAGRRYEVSMTITARTAGSIELDVGGGAIIAAQTVPGTYTVTYQPVADNPTFRLTGTLFTGSVSRINAREVS